MRSLAVGSIIAAVVMFALGFLFFGLLGMTGFAALSPEAAAAVQTTLGSQITTTGSYMVPPGEAEWMTGPSAMIEFIAAGDAPNMVVAMSMGFVHFLLTSLLIAYGLSAVGGGFARQARVLLWFAIAASAFMHLRDPIWYGFAWPHTLYLLVVDFVMLAASGLVLARWFTSARKAAPAGGTAA